MVGVRVMVTDRFWDRDSDRVRDTVKLRFRERVGFRVRVTDRVG